MESYSFTLISCGILARLQGNGDEARDYYKASREALEVRSERRGGLLGCWGGRVAGYLSCPYSQTGCDTRSVAPRSGIAVVSVRVFVLTRGPVQRYRETAG